MIQWMFFFFFYSFFGWCFESTYVSLKKRKLVNRGFMRGPFLPLYGTGAIMMLIISRPFQDSLVFTYIAGVIGATILEYVTGVGMEALFKVRYWDYSDQRFNYKGHICLSSSLAWGALTILMTKVIHQPVEQFMLFLPEWLVNVIVYLLTIITSADLALSFKAAMDLRAVLVKMEQAKEELERIQKRMDVLIAVVNEDISNKKKELELETAKRREESARRWEELEERFERVKEAMASTEILAESREEFLELRSRFKLWMEKRERNSFLEDYIKRSMIKGNPSMASARFGEVLEELKQAALEYKNKKKEKNEEK